MSTNIGSRDNIPFMVLSYVRGGYTLLHEREARAVIISGEKESL